MKPKVFVVGGPNLGRLGTREPEIYGTGTLEDINRDLETLASSRDVELTVFQSNHEGEILDFVEQAAETHDGFLVNAGALTHTSVALRDGFVGVGRPFVEVHLSNTQAREPFRAVSMLAPVAAGVVYGFGSESYLLGLRGLIGLLSQSHSD